MPNAFQQSAKARRDLVIGIDGGGTHTTCLLADAATGEIRGEGASGPSNIQSVGVAAGLRALDECIDSAFKSAKTQRSKVASACLGLAGVDWQGGLDIIHEWAGRVALAESVNVANDATLLLAAGTPEGWGLAVIAGTGSIAFVKSPHGAIGRCGGWGYVLGDEGSAYQVALSGLRAACRAFDHCAPSTSLLPLYLERMGLSEAPDLIPAVYRGAWDRSAIAGLAPLVLDAAAEGDAVAWEIVQHQTSELALTAASAVKNHGLNPVGIPVALAGGLLLGSEFYREAFLAALGTLGVTPSPVAQVNDPTIGAVKLACRKAAA